MASLTLMSVKAELEKRVGRHHAIKAPELVAEITRRIPDASATRTVRKLVKQLRLAGEPVCTHSAWGYWWASSPEELEAACQFLKGKAMSSLVQVSRLRRFTLPELAGQMTLPTAPAEQAPVASIVELPGDLVALVDHYLGRVGGDVDLLVSIALAEYLAKRGERSARLICDRLQGRK